MIYKINNVPKSGLFWYENICDIINGIIDKHKSTKSSMAFRVRVDDEDNPKLLSITNAKTGLTIKDNKLTVLDRSDLVHVLGNITDDPSNQVCDVMFNPYTNTFNIYTINYSNKINNLEIEDVVELTSRKYIDAMVDYFKRKFSNDTLTGKVSMYSGFSREEQDYLMIKYMIPFLLIDENLLRFDLTQAIDKHPLGLGHIRVTNIYDVEGKRVTSRDKSLGNDLSVSRIYMIYIPVSNIMDYMEYNSLNEINLREVLTHFFIDNELITNTDLAPRRFETYLDEYGIKRFNEV